MGHLWTILQSRAILTTRPENIDNIRRQCITVLFKEVCSIVFHLIFSNKIQLVNLEGSDQKVSIQSKTTPYPFRPPRTENNLCFSDKPQQYFDRHVVAIIQIRLEGIGGLGGECREQPVKVFWEGGWRVGTSTQTSQSPKNLKSVNVKIQFFNTINIITSIIIIATIIIIQPFPHYIPFDCWSI